MRFAGARDGWLVDEIEIGQHDNRSGGRL